MNDVEIAQEAAREIAEKIPHSFGFLQGREFIPIILEAIQKARDGAVLTKADKKNTAKPL